MRERYNCTSRAWAVLDVYDVCLLDGWMDIFVLSFSLSVGRRGNPRRAEHGLDMYHSIPHRMKKEVYLFEQATPLSKVLPYLALPFLYIFLCLVCWFDGKAGTA